MRAWKLFFAGIEINPEYQKMAEKRIAAAALAGFEAVGRIVLKDKTTGKEYK